MLVKRFTKYILRSLILLVIPRKLPILHLSSCYKINEE